MRRFQVYRPEVPQSHLDHGRAVDPSLVQVEGVEFTDGRVAVRWCTEHKSTSIWDSFEAFYAIHGHPEYGTVINWLDEPGES